MLSGAVLWLSLIGQGLASTPSQLIFPRLSFEPGTLIGIAVLNPTDGDALIEFSAYDEMGELIEAPDFQNPRQVEVRAGQQFAEVATSLFGSLPEDSRGWIEATSETPDLTGFFLYFEYPDFSFFDGADLPRTSQRLIFAEARIDQGFSTEIHLVNPGAETANVRVSLQGADATLASQTFELPGMGVRFVNPSELTAAAQLPAGSLLANPAVVRVASTRPVAGFSFVRQPEGDLLGLNAVPEEDLADRLYFPQMANGQVIRTELSLENLASGQTLVTLTAHREDGRLFGPGDVTTNPVSLLLSGGEVRRFDLGETFGFDPKEVNQGWLEVSADSRSLQGVVSYTLPGTGSLAAVSTTLLGSRQTAFSHLATDLGFFTGLALLNPSSLAADVRVLALARSGEILGAASRVLGPGERISQLLGVNLIPDAAGQSGGAVLVRSSVPIFLTSLFGRVEGSGVLANIPAQGVPSAFRPDRDLPQSRVVPALASLEPGNQLGFQLQMGDGEPTWKVSGHEGGNPVLGLVDQEGRYQAPSEVPLPLPVVVSAQTGDQEASASVDILSREVVAGNLGNVQSVAYVEGLNRLFVAETSIGGASAGVATQGAGSTIVEVTSGIRSKIRDFPGVEVTNIVSYLPPDGPASLLVVARSSGEIERLRLDTNQLTVVASGLNLPVAVVLDPRTGDLIVAQADRLSRVSAEALAVPASSPQGNSAGSTSLLENVAPRGVTVDSCTGDIYFSEGSATRRFNRATSEVSTVVDLEDPTRLLGTLRSGVSCPDGFHFFAVEPAANRITRVVPETGQSSLYAPVPGITDVDFRAAANPGDDGILTAEQADTGGQVEQLSIPSLYGTHPFNSPPVSPCIGQVQITDPNLAAVLRSELGLGPTETIGCDRAATATNLNGDSSGLTELAGIEALVNLQNLRLGFNQIADIGPVASLQDLTQLFLASNSISDISSLGGLRKLRSLGLGVNQISDISALSDLTTLEELLIGTNPVADLAPVSNLTNLTSFTLGGAPLTDLGPLSSLHNLQLLTLTAMNLPDLSPLQLLNNLQTLLLMDDQISDISALSGLSNLLLLDLTQNQISDATPLSGLSQILRIVISDNQISDITPFSNLTNLMLLNLFDNQVSDISPLVANPNFGPGTVIALQGNLLDAGDCADINALVDRGANIDIAQSLCP